MKAAISPGSRVRRKIACFLGFHYAVRASYSPMTVNGPTWVEACICGRRRVHTLHTEWTPWSHMVSDLRS
jgi:hypothetical protein